MATFQETRSDSGVSSIFHEIRVPFPELKESGLVFTYTEEIETLSFMQASDRIGRRARDRVAIRQPLAAEARVRSQNSQCDICDGQSEWG